MILLFFIIIILHYYYPIFFPADIIEYKFFHFYWYVLSKIILEFPTSETCPGYTLMINKFDDQLISSTNLSIGRHCTFNCICWRQPSTSISISQNWKSVGHEPLLIMIDIILRSSQTTFQSMNRLPVFGTHCEWLSILSSTYMHVVMYLYLCSLYLFLSLPLYIII